MPFGLKNAALAFHSLIYGIFCDLNFIFVYLGDILITQSVSQSVSQSVNHFVYQSVSEAVI